MAFRITPQRPPTPRPVRVRSGGYLAHIRKQKCAACGSPPPSQAAHIRTGNEGGTGLKPDDWLTVPLCHSCHADQESNPGAVWWIENVFKRDRRTAYERWLVSGKD